MFNLGATFESHIGEGIMRRFIYTAKKASIGVNVQRSKCRIRKGSQDELVLFT